MSVVKETYGYNEDTCHLVYRYSITGISTDQVELLDELEHIMNNALNKAEAEIEKELYKKGLMLCNASLESVDDMRMHGNELVLAHIEELAKKYKEN